MNALSILANTNHTPFFIAGGVLALWAVVLSAIGLSRSSFPADDKMTRVIIAFTGLLVVATLGTAIGTASTPDGEAGVPAERQAAKDAKIPEQVGVAPPVTPAMSIPKDAAS